MPKTKIEKADGLSKRLDWKVEVKKDNKNQTLIKEQWIHSLAKVVIKRPEVDILKKIKRWITDRGRSNVEKKKDIYIKG